MVRIKNENKDNNIVFDEEIVKSVIYVIWIKIRLLFLNELVRKK